VSLPEKCPNIYHSSRQITAEEKHFERFIGNVFKPTSAMQKRSHVNHTAATEDFTNGKL